MFGVYRNVGSLYEKDRIPGGTSVNSAYNVVIGSDREGRGIVGFYDHRGSFLGWATLMSTVQGIGMPLANAPSTELTGDLSRILRAKPYHQEDYKKLKEDAMDFKVW